MLERKAIGSLAIAGREALAMARQAWLLRHDIDAPVTPAEVVAGDAVVVFLHGLFATAGVLRPLRAAVTRHRGVHAATLTYSTGPGVSEIAARLGEVVRAIPAGARIHLVGHSLGGIVARHFAQEAGDARIAQTISMASPFAGIPRVGLLGFDGARDLEPQSPLLRRLLLRASEVDIPHLSIIAGSDAMVRSPVTHALPAGEVAVMEGRGHNALLFDQEVARLVERRVLALHRPPGSR
jgi:pimeloyl-ACP methyl ester carboxylesterase